MNGKIELRNYANSLNMTWELEAGCDEPNATITYLNTEASHDVLHVNGKEYFGEYENNDPIPYSVCLFTKISTAIKTFSTYYI